MSRDLQFPCLDEGLFLYSECLGDPVDVIEIGHYLGGVVNGHVIEASSAEFGEPFRTTLSRCARQFLRETAEGGITVAKPGVTPVAGDVRHKRVCRGGISRESEVVDLGTEVVGMGPYSVNAVISCRDDNSEKFTTATTEWGRAVHEGAVERHRGSENRRILTHDADDVPDSSSTAGGGIVFAL